MSVHRQWHYFNETARREWQNPEAVLDIIGLKPGFIFVDVGCGDGFFTIPASRQVGLEGKVYGIDITEQAIDELRKKAEKEGLTNLELIVGQAEKKVPCSACADIVFLGNVLHDFEEPVEVIKNARRIVKSKGILANIDWKKVPTDIGPPLSIRFDQAKAASLIGSAGFKVKSVTESGKYHYLIIASPI